MDFLTPRFDRIAGWFKQRMHGLPGIPSAVSTAVDDASSDPALSSGMVEEAKDVDTEVPESTTWAGLGEPPTVVPPTPPPPLPVHKPQPQPQLLLPPVPPSREEDTPERADDSDADGDADGIAPQALRPLLLQALARAARLRSAFTLLKVTIHAPTDRPLILLVWALHAFFFFFSVPSHIYGPSPRHSKRGGPEPCSSGSMTPWPPPPTTTPTTSTPPW